MNKIYRTVWNAAIGAWVVAQETARARGKGSRLRTVRTVLAASLAATAFGGVAMNAKASTIVPSTGTCSTGAGTINGVAYAAETNPIDGSGSYSLVAGCSASGGNMLAATAYGAFASVKGDYGVAMGFGSTAAGSATAVGMQANAGGTGSNAFGFTANAAGSNSVAIGSAASSSGANAIAIGNASTTTASNAVAIGTGATSLGNDAIVIGSAASSIANGVALGKGATVASTDSNNSGVALGNGSYANGVAVSTGYQTTASGSWSTALGPRATASATNATALGYGANASTVNSVALGNGATTAAAVATANGVIGDTTYTYAGTSPTGVVSVGKATAERQVTNVAAGQVTSSSTDAVNGSQLYATNTQVTANTTSITSLNSAVNNITNGGGIKYFHTNSSLADSVANGANSTAIGPAAAANYADDIAIGDGAAASRAGFNSQGGNVALGASASAQGYRSIAIGNGAQTNTGSLYNNSSDIAIGQSAFSEGYDSVALGNNANAGSAGGSGNNVAVGSSSYAKASGAVAFGGAASAAAANSTAIGALASTSAAGAVAIGTGANASTVNSVALGNGATTAAAVATANGVIGGTTYTYAGTTPTGVVSVGKAGAERQVTNVAAGRVTSTSTDAVNGSQLYATNTQVTANTTNISNLQGNVTTMQGQITSLNGQMADAVMYDSSAHASVTLGGVGASTNVKLSNVAVGTLSSTSSDAVNGSQLYATNTNVSNIAGNVTTLQSQITSLGGQMADAVLYDSSAHASVTLGGVGASTNVKLTNVAAGTLSSTSSDAVNGSQLYATNTQVTLNTTNISNLQGSVTTLQGDVSNIAGSITSLGGQMADAVMYDSSAHSSVTLGGVGASANVKLSNVAAGTLSSTSSDAVNGSQLYATNSNITTMQSQITSLGGQMADAVLYDSSAHASVTLGGVGASTNVKLSNVAAGTLSSTSSDAVNGSQLYATNTNVSNIAGNVTTLQSQITSLGGQMADAVIYDSSAHASVTLGGVGASTKVKLSNVAAGTLSSTSSDAVNGSQLYATNNNITTMQSQITSLGGQMADAVIYDSSAHDSVTLGGVGASTNVKLSNVAQGTLSSTSTDAVNGAQLYATNTQVTLNTTNISNLQGSVTTLQGDVSNLAGSITSLGGQMADAVMYDSSAHDSVTLGGAGSSTPVALHNVAAGAVNVSSTDAVNGSQLYKLASSTATGLGGGSTVNDDGSISGPTYNIGGSTFNNAGDAFTNIDGRVKDLSDALSSGTIGLVQQDATTRTITVAKGTDGNLVDFTGTAGTRVLTGVSAGALNAQSTDAVNGSQLYATNQQVAQNTTDIAGLQGNVTNLQGQMANAVMYDSSAHDSVTFGDGSTPVGLHNVAAGTANTDAVNVGQMNDAIASVQQAAEAAVNPFFAAQGNRDTEGAQATGAHATAAGANAVASGEKSVAIGANAQASGTNAVALGAGSIADRDNAVSVGSAGSERQITNVAAGTAGTDAVNVNQLNAMASQGQGYVDQRIAGVQNQISDVRKDAFGAAAAAMAVAGLPQPTEPGKTMVAAAGSRIGGQTGMALGVSYVTRNNRWVAKASASSSSQGNTGVTVGAGYQW
ncbi:Trimeric autotransporter adhesin [Paraburkholderia tropica]|nr:Trimeric autotransporter adhesin [Paraburkholderia tropica]